ncbi:MAG: hypothetical protein ACKVQS_00155 [Fimbriimonadaceae bacterium]
MSLDHRPFDGTEETLHSSLISDDELREVLQNLEEQELRLEAHEASPYDDWVTIKAICEATGHSENEIEGVLYDIRRANLASKISERLRELEEPLYRVERPGHSRPDPSAPALRIAQIDTILDKLLPVNQKHVRRHKNLEPTLSDRIASTIALIIGLIVVVGTIGLIVMTAFKQ